MKETFLKITYKPIFSLQEKLCNTFNFFLASRTSGIHKNNYILIEQNDHFLLIHHIAQKISLHKISNEEKRFF